MIQNKKPMTLLESASLIQSIGFLKSPIKCYANILYNQQEEICTQVMDNNNYRYLRLPLFQLNKDEREKIIKYIEVIFPVHMIQKNTTNIDIEKNNDWVPVLIEYELYEKLINIDANILPSEILAIKKRLEEFLSTPWQVTLKKLLKWPTTNAPLGLEDFFPNGWQETGLLSSSGYIVGKSGASEADRKLILSSLVENKIKLQGFRADYLSNWGEAATLDRLLKIARTIAVLCRNAKGSPHDFTKAIREWESDLIFLKDKYFYNFLNLDNREWPIT